MKQKRMEEKWLCQLCGKVSDDPKHHANTHRHKTNVKKIEDAKDGELIKHVEKITRWY